DRERMRTPRTNCAPPSSREVMSKNAHPAPGSAGVRVAGGGAIEIVTKPAWSREDVAPVGAVAQRVVAVVPRAPVVLGPGERVGVHAHAVDRVDVDPRPVR